VVNLEHITIDDKTNRVVVQFTPTIPHCSMVRGPPSSPPPPLIHSRVCRSFRQVFPFGGKQSVRDSYLCHAAHPPPILLSCRTHSSNASGMPHTLLQCFCHSAHTPPMPLACCTYFPHVLCYAAHSILPMPLSFWCCFYPTPPL
jgi:hypothetical protein